MAENLFTQLAQDTLAGLAAAPQTSGSSESTAGDDPVSAIVQVAQERGIDPAHLLGLAKLETRFGEKSVKGGGADTRNLFNVKDFSKAGNGIAARDNAEGSNDRYRQYGSYRESAEDLVGLLERKYPAALQARSPEEFAQALKQGGYATDPLYERKLANTIRSSTGSPANVRPVQSAQEWDQGARYIPMESMVGTDKPKPAEEGVIDGVTSLGKAFWQGAKSLGRSVMASGNTAVGDLSDVELLAEAQKADAKNNPRAMMALQEEIAKRKEANPDAKWWQALGDVGDAAWKNKLGTAQLIANQAPNSAVALGGAWAGGVAGAQLGAMAAPFTGGLSVPVGAGLGALTGRFLGNYAMEAGSKALDKADGGFTPEEARQSMTESAKKAAVVTAVDTATLGAGKLLGRTLFGAPVRAGARAEAQVLADAGVDITSKAAIARAVANNQALKEAAIEAGKQAAKDASKFGTRAAQAGIDFGMETAGEGVGEYYGEVAATGKGDIYDAALEALSSASQSGVQTVQAMRSAEGNNLDPSGIVRAARQSGGIVSRAGLAATPGAQQPAGQPGQPTQPNQAGAATTTAGSTAVPGGNGAANAQPTANVTAAPNPYFDGVPDEGLESIWRHLTTRQTMTDGTPITDEDRKLGQDALAELQRRRAVAAAQTNQPPASGQQNAIQSSALSAIEQALEADKQRRRAAGEVVEDDVTEGDVVAAGGPPAVAPPDPQAQPIQPTQPASAGFSLPAFDNSPLPKTDPAAAEEQRRQAAEFEQKRKVRRAATRASAWDRNPFLAFLGANGINRDVANEFAPGLVEKRKAFVPGYGPVFRSGAKNLDELVQTAKEDGFLREDDDVPELYDLIERSLRGERIAPLYADGAAEAEGQRRQQAMQEREGATFEDYLQQAEADDFDPFPLMADSGYDAQDLAGTDFDQADDAVRAEVAALAAQYADLGFDPADVLEALAIENENQPEQTYYDRARTRLTDLISQAYAQAQPQGSGAVRADRPEPLPAGEAGARGPAAGQQVRPAAPTPKLRNVDELAAEGFSRVVKQGGKTYFVNPDTRESVELDSPAQIARARARVQAKQRLGSLRNTRPQDFALDAVTPEALKAREEQAQAAQTQQTAEQQAAAAQAKADDERKRIEQASYAAADNFQLGQNPLDSLTGQQDIFSAAPADTPVAVDLAGERINDEWVAFDPQSGTLGIPRAEMPQIKAEHRGAMINFLKARGIDGQQETIPSAAIKPTQAEFSPAKVKQAMDYQGGNRSIIVSADGYVVDGHHQWLAAREKGEPIPAIRLDQNIGDVLAALKDMPSAQPEQGGRQDAARDYEADMRLYPSRVLEQVGANGELDKLYAKAGARGADAFGRLSADKQAAAYAAFVADGGKPVGNLPQSYNDSVMEEERQVRRRQLQGERTITQSNGKPFKTEAGAKSMLDEFDLSDTHKIVSEGGGYALRQMPPAEQAEVRRKAEGRESYMEAQAAVIAEMGIQVTEDGEIDATDEQWDEIDQRIAARMGQKPIKGKTGSTIADQLEAIAGELDVIGASRLASTVREWISDSDMPTSAATVKDAQDLLDRVKKQREPDPVAELLDQHFKLSAELTQAFNSGKGDAKNQLRLMDESDQVARKLIEAGYTQDQLGANALGVTVDHFKEMVKDGIYSREYGARDELFEGPIDVAGQPGMLYEQRRRSRLEREISTGMTNNGGVMAKLRPSAIEKRKQELAAMVGSTRKRAANVMQQPNNQAPSEQDAETAANDSQYPLVTHTTAKGKVLRGYIVRGMTKEQVKANIDEYPIPVDGGFFVREKHKDKLPKVEASKQPAAVPAPQDSQAGAEAGEFDSAAFDKARNDTIQTSRDAGNTHLDQVPAYVETMRGKAIFYVHDPKVTGVIRTVDNNKNVYVDWSDAYSAEKEMASPTQDGKKTVYRSTIGPRDLKDYALAPDKREQGSQDAASQQGITADDVAAAEKQAAQMIEARIDAMKAPEVQRIAARFLPTVGVKVPMGKAKIKVVMTDAAAMNLLAPAGELGIELSESVKRALVAKMEGRVEAGQPAQTQAAPEKKVSAPKWDAAKREYRRTLLSESGIRDQPRQDMLSKLPWSQLTDPIRKALDALNKTEATQQTEQAAATTTEGMTQAEAQQALESGQKLLHDGEEVWVDRVQSGAVDTYVIKRRDPDSSVVMTKGPAGPRGVQWGKQEAARKAVETMGLPQERALAGREGYDTPVELDAAQLKAILEQTRGEPLVDKPAKLEAWRNGTAKTDPAKFPIELFLTSDGRLDVNDGRHRIALAAERGEKVTAFIDGKDVQSVQDLLEAATTNQAAGPATANADLEAIFDQLDGLTQRTQANGQRAAAAHPQAERIQFVQKHILDILQDLKDTGKVTINC